MTDASDQPPPAMVEITTAFRYHHGLGDLAPHFAGLERGEAWATRCPACNAVWFAPRLICRCGARGLHWVRLPGTGNLLAATEGEVAIPLTGRTIACATALIRMDGADNAVLGRLGDGTAAKPGMRVRLGVDPGPRVHPVQAAWFLPVSD